MAREKETFVARVHHQRYGGTHGYDFESPPKTSVQSAMATVDAQCKAGKYITVKSNYTSNGDHWPGHRGRIMATCERKAWFVETFPPGDHGDPSGRLKGARGRCPANIGRKRAPARLRRKRGAR
jgi:hypothetical protein